MRDVVISPHLDDAVLSMGGHLTHAFVTVTTIFAGYPEHGTITDYDRDCGFSSSVEAVQTRRDEDREAIARVNGVHEHRVQHANFLDSQYRNGEPPPVELIREYIGDHISTEWSTFVPLGLGHPDHRFVAECCRDECPEGLDLLLYEELPYKVMWPEKVKPALDLWAAAGFDLDVYPIEQGDIERKAHAVAAYRSQFPDGMIDPCLRVPERVWIARRNGVA